MAKANVELTAQTSEFSAGLQRAQSALRATKSEVSALEKGFDKNTSAQEKFEKAGGALKRSIDQAKDVVSRLNQDLDREKDNLNKVAKALEDAKKNGDSNSKAVKELQIEYDKQSKAVNDATTKLNKAQGEVNGLSNKYNDLERKANGAGDEIKTSGEKADGAAKGGFTVLKGVLANLATKAITTTISGLSKGLSALKDFGLSAVEVGKQFDASMSNVAALSGATGDDLKLLSDTAQHYGKTTQFSASEAADALGYMALAGWDAKQSAESLGGVLQLAAASGMGLAEASDMVTDYLSAFSNSAMTSTQFADMLAYAQANSNTSAQQLGEAYQNCAAKMNAAGQSAATTTALLGAMANQGYKGSNAGTALASVLKDLTAKMQNGSIEINKQKIAVQDAEGNYRNLIDILYDVEAATDGMGTAQKNAALSSVFTSKSLSALSLIFNEGFENIEVFEEKLGDTSYQLWYLTENLGLSEEKAKDLLAAIRNSDRSEEAIKRIAKEFGVEATQIQRTAEFFAACDGAAQKMADTMNDNLAGDIKAANSALEGFKITISDQLTPTIRDFVQFGTSELGKLDDAFKSGGIEGFADQLGKSLSDGIEKIKKVAPKAITVAKTIVLTVGREVLKIASDLFTKFINNFGKYTEKALSIVKSLGSKILSKLPGLFEKIISQLPGLLQKIGIFLRNALPKVVETIGQMLGSLLANAPAILNAGVELVKSLVTGVLTAIPRLFTGIHEGFTNSFNKIADEVPSYVQKMNDSLAEFREGLESIPDAAESIAGTLAEIDAKQKDAEHWIEIYDKLHSRTDLTTEEHENLNTAVGHLIELYPELEEVINNENGLWTTNTEEIEKNIQMLTARYQAEAYYSAAKETLEQISKLEVERNEHAKELKAIEEKRKGWSDELATLQDITHTTQEQRDRMQELNHLLNSSLDDWGTVNKKVKECDEKIGSLNKRKDVFYALSEAAKNGSLDFTKSLKTAFDETGGDLDAFEKRFREALSRLPEDSYLSTKDTELVIQRFRGALYDAHGDFDLFAEAFVTSLSDLPDKSEEAFHGVSVTIKDELDNASDNAYEGGLKTGKETVRGIKAGIDDQEGPLMSRARGLIKSITQAMRDQAMIKSPSRLTRDLIGKNLGLGIGVGFEDALESAEMKRRMSMTTLFRDLRSTINTDDLTASINYSLDGSNAGIYRGANKSVTVGKIEVTIQAAPGMSADDLYEAFRDRLNEDLASAEAVFA